jgi:threonine dehydrogenase-like Zn-dependent dehydrogenase
LKGLWLKNGTLEFRNNIPDPVPEPGECLIRVTQAGICSTDIAMINGLNPFDGVLGHEFVGIVKDSASPLNGKRVVAEIYTSCGDCSYCRAGLRKHCQNGRVIGIINKNGAFADYISMPEQNLYVVPDDIEDRAAVFVEPLAAALDILEKVEIGPDTSVMLIGAGKLGQLAARVLATTSCPLTIVTRNESKKARLQSLGADLITSKDLSGMTFDVVIDCTGDQDGLTTALAATRPRGTLVLKSTVPGLASVDMTRVVVDEINIVGSRCGPYAKALEYLQRGTIETKSLIDASFSIGNSLEAMATAQQSGILKVLLELD